jgi:hypothetical protein
VHEDHKKITTRDTAIGQLRYRLGIARGVACAMEVRHGSEVCIGCGTRVTTPPKGPSALVEGVRSAAAGLTQIESVVVVAAKAPLRQPTTGAFAVIPDPTQVEGASDQVDAILQVHVTNLFDYAKANERDARQDNINYWALKAPAIVGAAAASAFEAFGVGAAVIVLATVAAICSAVDAARPRGLLHNVHRKAANEASLAGTALQAGWHLIQIECANDPDARRTRAADLLREAQAERQRISSYVTAAEASLGSSTRTEIQHPKSAG